jgi:hypothetical protein
MCSSRRTIRSWSPSMRTTAIFRTLTFLCAVAPFCLRAQSVAGGTGTAALLGSPLGQSPRAPNVLFLGMATSVSYDTNVANTQNNLPNSQYTLYPQFGLSISRPRWTSLVTYMPGVSYSSASIPSYNAVSQMFGAAFQYRATKRLTFSLLNSFLSSSNPFDSLRATSVLPQFGVLHTPTAVAWDYLPKTNEQAALDATYSLSARTKIQVGGAYNYISYQDSSESNLPGNALRQSNSGQFTFGLFRTSGAHYSSGVQYTGQQLDAGKGEVRTSAQSIAYQLQYSPRPSFELTAIIGPQHVDTTYKLRSASDAITNVLNEHGTGWSWMGGGTLSWTGRRSGLSASLIRQLSTGNQYQGAVRQTLANVQVQQQLTKQTTLNSFVGYNINEPPFSVGSPTRLSNNYLSAGTGVSRKFGNKWTMSVTYWYLRQDKSVASDPKFYSGDHSRVAFSLSYLIAKPIRR